MTVEFQICGFITSTCGTMCSDNPQNCCSICQRWAGDQPGSACLGLFDRVVQQPDGVSIYYQGGDPVTMPDPPGLRFCWINITSAPEKVFNFTKIIEPTTNGHLPGAPYVYTVFGTSNDLDPCLKIKDCQACAKASCRWCLDSAYCAASPCPNWVGDQSFCPASGCNKNSCSGCLRDSTCEYCLQGGCQDSGSGCRAGRVVAPRYCPMPNREL